MENANLYNENWRLTIPYNEIIFHIQFLCHDIKCNKKMKLILLNR